MVQKSIIFEGTIFEAAKKDEKEDIKHLHRQLNVATALANNPTILEYLIAHAESDAYELTKVKVIGYEDADLKAKVVEKQARIELVKSLYELAHSVEEIQATIQALNTVAE